MAVREIVTLPDPILRKKAHKVTKFDDELRILINDMIETMREAPGVGLAAPQMGVPRQVIVIEFGNEENEEIPLKLYTVVNPEIIKHSTDVLTDIEACLSIPGLVGDVDRYEKVVVKGLNRFGKPMKIKAKGWLARIFQHEIGHVNGVLYTDLAHHVWQPQEDEEILAV